MRIPDGNRKALTLLEVLITIFIMGIGFLSVLTLFPLAARKIVRGIDSDRATLIAGNSIVALQGIGLRDFASQVLAQELVSVENSKVLSEQAQTQLRTSPSSIVHMDPAGFFANNYNGGNPMFPPTGSWPAFSTRRPGYYLQGWNKNIPFESFRDLLVSQDEMQFTPQGTPEIGFRRGARYSISFQFRRPLLGADLLECLVLVYIGRPVEFQNDCEHDLIPLSDNGIGGPAQGGAPRLRASATEIMVQVKNGPADPDRTITRGSWLMDTTCEQVVNTTGGQKQASPRWNHFYQVTEVEQNGNIFRITLDKPVRADIYSLVWVDYLFEVFDRGTGQ